MIAVMGPLMRYSHRIPRLIVCSSRLLVGEETIFEKEDWMTQTDREPSDKGGDNMPVKQNEQAAGNGGRDAVSRSI